MRVYRYCTGGLRTDAAKEVPLEHCLTAEIDWKVGGGAGREQAGGNNECEGAGACAGYSGNLLRSHMAGELGVSWTFAALCVVLAVWGGG